MRVRLLRNGEVVNTVDVKAKSGTSRFDVLRRIEAMQKTEDVLKIGMLGDAVLGINSLHCVEGIWQVSSDNKGIYKFDGTERNLKFDVRMYEPGFVLGTGRTGTNLLGMSFDAYLSNLGRSKIRCAPKSDAKVFPTAKAVKTFIENHRSVFEYLVKKYGYEWSVEYANSLSEEDDKSTLSEMTSKRREKEVVLRDELNALLSEINDAEEENRMPEEIPEVITPEVMKKEALRRMKLLDMWDNVIRDFEKDGTVYMSEGGGIIYDLDEKAKSAVEEVEADDRLP